MQELIHLLLVPTVIAFGFYISRQQYKTATAIVCVIAFFHCLVGIMLAASGLANGVGFMRAIHHYAGLGIVISVWPFTFFSLGVAIEQGRRSGYGKLTSRVLTLFFCLILVLFTSFTGYLSPSHVPDIGRDSHNRFIVLHMIVAPTMLMILLSLWCWLYWPERASKTESP